ncbi:phosphomannomutase [Methylotenera sp.]|uniref:phosphomannomutase n=1 Tax=Methylotenera sp. TaxID=2051956 RepID=UPI00248A06FB|nr:phosphomannomutase [Methylotenera sp.]MDI1299016.1 phosphomannomutase [Methylotenera sp.]
MNQSERTISLKDLIATNNVRFGTSGARGLVVDMTDDVCFAYTLAFLETMSIEPQSSVALAIDLRPSSPRIAAVCAAAIEYAGFTVDFCADIPTPALAFYAQQQGIPAMMITGSHIPFDRNGIKFYGLSGEITKDDEVSISQAIIRLPQVVHPIDLTDVHMAARQMYINRYLDYFEPHCLAGMQLGFYEHSSVARDLLREILEALGAQVTSLNRTNEFIPIDTEAVAEVDIKRAHKWASENKFDAIISTDGDADRPLIADEQGRWMRGDVVGLLCAHFLNAQAVATPVSCNTAIEKSGVFSTVIRTRIGSPYVIAGMEQLRESGLNSIVGFEANGGFLLGSSMVKDGRVLALLNTRDAALPILSVLSMAKGSACKLSELSQTLPARYTASDRLQLFPSDISSQLLLELAASISSINQLLKSFGANVSELDQTDGLRITFDNDEIVHFRPSGNAPELRCYAEAEDPIRAEYLARTALKLIRKRVVI